MATPTPAAPLGGRHVVQFVGVAILLEVVLALSLLLTGADAAIEAGLAAAGLDFNTDLVTAARVLVVYPAAALGIALALAQVAAPDLAVVVVTRGRWHGPGGLAEVAGRLRPWAREVGLRRGLRTWAHLVAVFLLMNLATAGIDRLLLGDAWEWNRHLLTWSLPLALLVTMFLDAGALLEENGWRGFALPILRRRYSPVVASLLLGLAWAAWHYPVKYDALRDHGVAGLWYLAAFTLKIVLLSLVITAFWERTGRSTLAAIAMHGLSNDSMRVQGLLIGEGLRVDVVGELTICAPMVVVTAWLLWRGQLRPDLPVPALRAAR